MAKVLVVDDEKNLRTLYETELAEEGHTVILASDGKEALRLLETERPDLVVLDIRMPGLDGLETMGRMLATGGMPGAEASGNGSAALALPDRSYGMSTMPSRSASGPVQSAQ